jgi:membrane-associated phospholipid phosphatase
MIWRKLLEIDLVGSRRLGLAERPGLLRSAAAAFAHSGDSWFWLAGLGVLWLAGSDFWKARAAFVGGSILLTAVLVLLIKFGVRRPRPEGEWGAVYRKTDPHSFPSGHAARAALIAALFIGLGPPWLGAALAVWAPLVLLSRVAMGVHYLSDVIAGAALGLLIGMLLLRFGPLV